MGVNYLICRRASTRVLIPAMDVDGVRELAVHAAPPDALPWIAGVAVTEHAAVVVVSLQAGSVRSHSELQRVVVLRRGMEASSAACGVLVDEVVELRELDVSASASAGRLAWQLRDDHVDGVIVDASALATAVNAGGVR